MAYQPALKELLPNKPQEFYENRAKLREFKLKVELYLGANILVYDVNKKKILFTCALLKGAAAQ